MVDSIINFLEIVVGVVGVIVIALIILMAIACLYFRLSAMRQAEKDLIRLTQEKMMLDAQLFEAASQIIAEAEKRTGT